MPELNHYSQLKLKIAYWYITHKIFLQRTAFFLVLLICLGLIGYGVYGLSYHFATLDEFNKIQAGITRNRINFKVYRLKNQPSSLIIDSVAALKSRANQYDLLAKVTNPNRRWFIKKVNYQFVSNGYASPVFVDFILPSQEKYLVAFNQSISSPPDSLILKIFEPEYQRVKTSPEAVLADFLVENVDFVPSGSNAISLPRIKFKITNQSIFNFWELPVKIILSGRSHPVGVNQTIVSQFLSDETRAVEFAWLDEIKYNVSKIIVSPDINLFDQSNYLPAAKTAGEPK